MGLVCRALFIDDNSHLHLWQYKLYEGLEKSLHQCLHVASLSTAVSSATRCKVCVIFTLDTHIQYFQPISGMRVTDTGLLSEMVSYSRLIFCF